MWLLIHAGIKLNHVSKRSPYCVLNSVLNSQTLGDLNVFKAIFKFIVVPDCWPAPSHFLNRFWNIVNLTPGNKLQWNLDLNLYMFIKWNAFENFVCETAAILSRSQCVNDFVLVVQVITSKVVSHEHYNLMGFLSRVSDRVLMNN